MNLKKAQKKLTKLIQVLKSEFEDSNYIIVEDPLNDNPIQITLSGSFTPEGYSDNLLITYEKLKAALTFINSSSSFLENKLTLWAINELMSYSPEVWEITNTITSDIHVSTKDFDKLIQLFQKEKKKTHSYIVSDLKAVHGKEQVKGTPKITWSGKQTDLVDLINILIDRGWIVKPILTIRNTDLADLLNSIFIFPTTSEKGSSDKSQNLRRYLQGRDIIPDGPFNLIQPRENHPKKSKKSK